MGAFYIVHEPARAERERLCGIMEASLRAQGFEEAVRARSGNAATGFFAKYSGTPAQVYRSADEFCALSGTALYHGKVGAEAARLLLAREPDEPPDFSRLTGNFCVVRSQAEGVRLFTDPLGVYKVYCTRDLRLFSSSFLAIAAAVGRVTPDVQGVYEYVHQEATYGGATVCEEIRLARPDGCYRLADDSHFTPRVSGWNVEDVRAQGGFAEHLDACVTRLRTLYAEIANAFGDSVDTALSGGYDSRLTLALLLEQGVRPSVHVYGSADSSDVTVARSIADAEGFALQHVDKSRIPGAPDEHYADAVRGNFLAFDGYPPAAIFDRGVDRETRRERAAGGRLMLNGGGGEIFRNFFYLPSRAYTPRELVWSFYNRYAPSWCTERFDEAHYVESLASKVARTVGGGEKLTREQIEYAYPAFRCGYWMGRNNSLNARFGWALTPFIDFELVRHAVAVPLRFKNYGRFEAALIRAVSPTLSRYASDYGHAFDREPPLRRVLRDQTTLLRPTWLRRYTYRLRFRKPREVPAWLQPQMLRRIVNPDLPIMSQFFHVSRMNDPAAFGRVATLEYLFQELGSGGAVGGLSGTRPG